MALLRIAVASAHFGRDLAAGLARAATLMDRARTQGAGLLVLPHGTLGGYLHDLRHPGPADVPPALELTDPAVTALVRRAGRLVVACGVTEALPDGSRSNTAVLLSGDGVLGVHRKVHLLPAEREHYRAGVGFAALDSPVGTVGLLVDYDKTFPESARALAEQGAQLLACPCAWPASLTRRASALVHDRQTRLFDLYDAARAAENQVVLASANLTGVAGGLRYVGSAKVVDPSGRVLARTGTAAGLAVAAVDLDDDLDTARRVLFHLAERRPTAYGPPGTARPAAAPPAVAPAPPRPDAEPVAERAGHGTGAGHSGRLPAPLAPADRATGPPGAAPPAPSRRRAAAAQRPAASAARTAPPSRPGTAAPAPRTGPARRAGGAPGSTAPGRPAGRPDQPHRVTPSPWEATVELYRSAPWPVVVVGGGQAGLAQSWHLTRRGIEHVVLERGELGHTWRDERWDSFCLVTPNWQCQLPGFPYRGPDPDGFMPGAQVLEYLRGYAAAFGPPLVEGVAVTAVRPAAAPSRLLAVHTPGGVLHAEHVVLAVSGYHHPRRPGWAAALPGDLTVLHSRDYRSPQRLPAGAVLVVGSGQSGAQIAEDLHLAGRQVHLATGSAPRVARRYRGRDVVAWLSDMGHYRLPVDQHPQGVAVRRNANHYVTGRGGGRDIDLRAFARDGMALYGRVLDADGPRLRLADDLADHLDRADAVSDGIKDTIDAYLSAAGIDAPPEPRTAPVWRPPAPGPTDLDLAAAQVRSVVFATGFRSDFSWVDLPVFDTAGYPTHHRGVTADPRLCVLGLPWLHTWGSGRLVGVGADAEHLTEHLVSRLGGGSTPAPGAAAGVRRVPDTAAGQPVGSR